MGTFHQGKSELHGTTVVVETAGEVFVGRCDDMDERTVVLLDADGHRDGDGGKGREEFLRRAAEVGVWPRHRRLVLPRGEVVSVRRLGEL